MKQTKHTPGHIDIVLITKHLGDAAIKQAEKGNEDVESLLFKQINVLESNSNLIAAAPEMLEALEALVSAMPMGTIKYELVKEKLEVAKQVIAKARGES